MPRVLAALAFFALLPAAAIAQNLTTAELQQIGQRAAAQYGVPWSVFSAQIQGESGWNPNPGTFNTGAVGIAQFLPSTAASLGVDPNDPTSALYGAAHYDQQLFRQSGSWTGALTDYTGGLTASNPGNPAYAAAFQAAQVADAGTAIANNGASGGATSSIAPAADAEGTNMNGSVLDQITQAFQTATQGWQSGLYTVALDLFGILALIDLVAALILLVVQGGKPDFSDVAFTIIRWLIPVGLFLWIMQNAPTFSADIVNSLRQAATAAGGSAITPSAVLTAGVNAAAAIWAQMHNTWNPATLVALMVCDLLICVAFCLAAVWMCAALVEAYFVIGASALFVAFGAMRWSREIAVSLLRFCLAIGMKLFAISMIVAIGSQFIQQWTKIAANLNIQGLFTIVGCSIALAALAKIVPDTMQRVILAAPMSLAHHSQWRGEVAGAAAIAAAPVLGAAGLGALGVQAFRYGAEKLTETDQEDKGRIARAVEMTGAMGGGLSKAAGAEIGGRLGGRMRGGATASMVRMAQNISQQRRVNAAERSRPQPPNNPGNSAGSSP